MKRSRLDMPTISLTFWMLAVTAAVMRIASLVFEHTAWRRRTGGEAAILYNTVMICGFAHVVWLNLARTLPAGASILWVMMIRR